MHTEANKIMVVLKMILNVTPLKSFEFFQSLKSQYGYFLILKCNKKRNVMVMEGMVEKSS